MTRIAKLMVSHLRQAALGLLALIFALTSFMPAAQAGYLCSVVHSQNKYAVEWRVEIEGRKTPLDENGNVDPYADRGVLRLSDGPLTENTQHSVMELLQLLIHTRAVRFNLKHFEGKAEGELVLGIPLINKYSIELTYESDARIPSRPRYVPTGSLHLILPSGDKVLLRKNVLDENGHFNIKEDLTKISGLRDYDFNIRLPEQITPESLAAFKEVAPKLDLLKDKAEVEKIAKTNDYKKLRSAMNRAWMKEMVKEFFFLKGTVKTAYKVLVFWPLRIIVGGVLVWNFGPQVVDTYAMLKGPDSLWAVKAVEKAAESEVLPDAIKKQFQELGPEIEQSFENAKDQRHLLRNHRADLNKSSRIDYARDESIWIQTSFDKELNQNVTLMFIGRYDSMGQMRFAVTRLDEKKYSTLINYVQSRGNFMPLMIHGGKP